MHKKNIRKREAGKSQVAVITNMTEILARKRDPRPSVGSGIVTIIIQILSLAVKIKEMAQKVHYRMYSGFDSFVGDKDCSIIYVSHHVDKNLKRKRDARMKESVWVVVYGKERQFGAGA